MRFFGLYFAFFCFAFSYLFKGDAKSAAVFGFDMLFSYFVFTSALAFSAAFIAFLALRKGFGALFFTGFFGGLIGGAAAMFFIVLAANRGSLLLGSYLLSSAFLSNDIYEALIGALFLFLGYSIFRPFNFSAITDFKQKSHNGGYANQKPADENGEIIDVQIVEDFNKANRK